MKRIDFENDGGGGGGIMKLRPTEKNDDGMAAAAPVLNRMIGLVRSKTNTYVHE